MPALLPGSAPFPGSPHQQQLDTLSPSAGSSSPSSPQPSSTKRGRKKTKPEKPAANEHLPPRTSCDSCRTRKLKCDGRSMADGGCERCSREKTTCHYSIRAPIGRPKGSVCPVKKRKVARGSDEKPASPSVVEVISSASPFQPTGSGYALSPPSALQPFAALQYAVDQQQRQQQGFDAGNGESIPTTSYTVAGPQAYYRVPVDEIQAPLYSGSYPNGTSNTQTPATSPGNGMSLKMQQPTSSFAASSTSHGHLMDSPLATLEMAAFLDSLDRVEIKPADGLTANMLPKGRMQPKQNGMPYQQLQRPATFLGQDSLGNEGVPVYSQPTSEIPPFAPSHQTSSYQGSQSYTNQNQVSILDEGVSYAVPSDFSWWDLGLDANLMGGAGVGNVNKEVTNAAVDSAQHGFVQAQKSAWSDEGLNGGPQQEATSVVLATSSPHISRSGEPRQIDKAAAAGKSSCCSKKPARKPQATPPSQLMAPPVAKSCCSKSAGEKSDKPDDAPAPVSERFSGPCPKTGAANCCCDPREQLQSEGEQPPTDGSFSSDDEDAPTVRGTFSKETPGNNTHTQPRVHCVPNPSGTGCTCLCESSVCLLGVRRTLGHPLPISSSSYEDDLDAAADVEGRQQRGDKKTPIPSLHLTLSASRAISDSCACSASCPTCCGAAAAGSEAGAASASSHAAFNASLLISLALQIYARAVRILRDGFSSSSSASNSSGDAAASGSGSGSGSGSSSVDGVVGGLEIKIGGYRPSKENARRIALLAIRLELSDLEKGMGRVYKMAGGGEEGGAEGSVVRSGAQGQEGGETRSDVVKREVGGDVGSDGRPDGAAVGPSTGAGADKPTQPPRRLLAPVDGLVICKLREQLREMISRVEALERL